MPMYFLKKEMLQYTPLYDSVLVESFDLIDISSLVETVDVGPLMTVTDVTWMNPVAQLLTSGSNDADLSSYSTSSITAGENTLLIVFAVSTHASADAPAITVSGLSSVTWTEITNVLFGAASTPFPGRLSAWQGVCGATPGSGTLTISATSSTSCKWTVLQVDQFDSSGTIVQSPTVNGAAGTTGTVTLAAAGSSKNRPLSAFAHLTTEGKTPRTNWTELGDVTTTAPTGGLESQFRADAFETTASATWATSGRYGAIALEVKALAAV